MTESPELPKITPELPKPPANPPDVAAPVIPEAAKAGPEKLEPVKSGSPDAAAPAAPEPAKVGPAKVEPVKSEPNAAAPAAPELVKPGPAKVGPAKSVPDAAAPAVPKPAKPAPEISEPPKAAVPPAPAAPPRPRAQASRSALAVLSAVGFLLLVGAMFYLWQQVQTLARQSDPSQIAVLNGEIRDLRQRVARLEQQPAPVPPAPPVDLGPLTARVEALEQRPTAAPDNTSALSAEVTALQGRVAQAEANAGQVSDAASRSARLQAAGVALSFGQPLGNIPGAPPALSRFAATNPPTEASLRQEFSAAARQAQAVSQPDTSKLSLGARIWQRVTSLATVRQGNTVLVGAPAAVALGSAQDKLEAGDLAGAVAALDALDGPAAQAMADWRAKAQSLLDARAALAAMARG
jgi:hypothetical protein